MNMDPFRRLIGVVDRVSEWFGRIGAWILPALVLVMTYEVLARYVFNAPTKWAFDLSWMMFAAIIVLGLPYVILHDGNVRMDILYARWSNSKQLLADAVLTLVMLIPVSYFLLHYSIEHTIWSYEAAEKSRFGYWQPLLWPIRAIVTIGLFVLLLAAISWLVRNVVAVLRRERQ